MTVFIGTLFSDTADVTKTIRPIIDKIQQKHIFVPQRYLHVTLIYLGNEKEKKYISLTNLQTLKYIKHKKCIFSHLDFIGTSLVFFFKFEDCDINLMMDNLMKEQNNSIQAHITLGKIDIECKQDFNANTKHKISELLENINFNFNLIELINVDKFKNYNSNRVIC